MKDQFTEKAFQLRNDLSVHYNCAQTVLVTFADECGLGEKQAAALGSYFGAGMMMGSVCGVITAGAMVLGLAGASNEQYQDFLRTMRAGHDGLVNCRDLLARAKESGIDRKTHCDGLIYEAVENLGSIINNIKEND